MSKSVATVRGSSLTATPASAQRAGEGVVALDGGDGFEGGFVGVERHEVGGEEVVGDGAAPRSG